MIRLFIILALCSYAPQQVKLDEVVPAIGPEETELMLEHELVDVKLQRMLHRI